MSLISRLCGLKLSKAVAPVVENLEQRLCLSVSLVNGTLNIYGRRHASQISVYLDSKNSKVLDVNINGQIDQFNAADVKKIYITALRGDSKVQISNANGTVTAPATILGGGGNDTLIGGGAGDLLKATGGNNLMIEHTGHNTLIGGTGHDTLMGGANDVLVKGSKNTIADHWHATNNTVGHYHPAESTITLTGTPKIGYNPAQIRSAYGMPDLGQITTTKVFGAGQTIAIVTAMDDPTAMADLNVFSKQFNLPTVDSTSFSTIGDGAGSGVSDPDWAVEAALDLEWAHVMAPQAKLILVEAADDTAVSIDTAITQAAAAVAKSGGIVSMSLWADGTERDGPLPTPIDEGPITTTPDSLFSSSPNVSFIGATGDQGGAVTDPAQSSFVTAVGGTSINIDSFGDRISETAYANTGGGPSTTVPTAFFQTGLTVGGTASIGSFRGTPDISMVADPNPGIVAYTTTATEDPTTFLPNSSLTGWFTTGGTSAGAPMFAGIVADANSLRANLKLPILGQDLNNQLYQLAKIDYSSLYNDITTGNNTTHAAGPGYDFATGLGTPKGAALINGLAGILKAPPETMRADYVVSLANPLNKSQGIYNFLGAGTATVNATTTRVNISLGTTQITNATLNLTFTKVVIGSKQKIAGHAIATVLAANGDLVNFNLRVDGHIVRAHHRWFVEGEFFAVDPFSGARLNQGNQPTFYGRFTF